jgi:protease-4
VASKQDKILGLFILGAFVIFAVIVLMVLVGLSSSSSDIEFTGGGDKIAVVEVNGVIMSSRSVNSQLKRYKKDNSIKAIILHIDSPGGGVAASQEIYESVRRVRESGKPVVACMASVAASGGYYAALCADSIMAGPGTTTGSIGVIAEIPNFTKLMDKLGISMTIIKSGRYKDSGTPYREMTPADKQYLQSWIDESYDQFISIVATERGMSLEQAKELGDGRVYSGRQAYEFALIDTLGTFDDAVQLAADIVGIDGEPRLVRQQKRKMTPFELMFKFDLQEFAQTYISTWPRIQYLMSY